MHDGCALCPFLLSCLFLVRIQDARYVRSLIIKVMHSLHIGSLIKEELMRQERTISWLARKLYCDRSNVYHIFKRESIDTELLLRICLILGRNFFLLYVDEFVQKSQVDV